MLPSRNGSYYCCHQGTVHFRDKQAGCVSWLEAVCFFIKFRSRSICALPQSLRDVLAWHGHTCGLSHRPSMGHYSQGPVPPSPVLSPELGLQSFMADHYFQIHCELGTVYIPDWLKFRIWWVLFLWGADLAEATPDWQPGGPRLLNPHQNCHSCLHFSTFTHYKCRALCPSSS